MYTIIRFRLVWLLLATLALFLSSRDAVAGPKAYVGNFKDNTVSVIDTVAGKVVSTIPVGMGPHGMGITPDGRWLYVSNDGASTLSLIDTTTDSVTRTIEVGKSPHGVALIPKSRLLLVCVNGDDRVAFVDTSTQAVVATVAVAKPHTVSVRSDGKEAYVASQEPGHFAVVVVDLAKRAVIRTIALDKPPRDLEFGYGSKALYFTKAGVNAVEVLDPASDKIIAEIPTGVSPHYVNLFRGTTLGMTVVQGPGELLLFDPVTNAPVRSIQVGKQPHWLAVLGDGKTVYVTNEGSNDVSVADIASGKTTTIAVGNAPRKVVVQPATGDPKVSIANFAFVPQVVTIAPGDSVTWNNDDGAPHTITFKDGSSGSDTLYPGKTYSRTFDQAGSYEYFCSIHNYMTGSVIVRSR